MMKKKNKDEQQVQISEGEGWLEKLDVVVNEVMSWFDAVVIQNNLFWMAEDTNKIEEGSKDLHHKSSDKDIDIIKEVITMRDELNQKIGKLEKNFQDVIAKAESQENSAEVAIAWSPAKKLYV